MSESPVPSAVESPSSSMAHVEELTKDDREKLTLFQLISENVHDLIAVISESRKRVWHNDAYCEHLGYTREELSGADSQIQIHPDDLPKVREVFELSMQDGIGRKLEYRMQRKNGSWIFLESQGKIVHNVLGASKCLVLVARDITARKQLEAERQARQERREKQSAAVVKLTRSSAFREGDWEKSMEMIAETGSSILACSSTNIWWLNETETFFELDPTSKSALAKVARETGQKISIEATSDYLMQLFCDRTQASEDLSVSSLEFGPHWKDYFDRQGVSAVLHAPLFRSGVLVGVVSFEQNGGTRHWHTDEMSFGASLTDLVMLTREGQERRKAHVALVESQEHLAAELNDAAEYVRSLLPPPIESGRVVTDWKFDSCSALGGDAFGYNWIDDEHFALYLLDVCGHGVGAALLSISAINVLRNQSLPDTDFHKPDQVLFHINNAFPMERQNNNYFTLWYAVYHAPTRKLVYGSAGHPAPIFFAGGLDAEPQELTGNGTFIGAVEDIPYQSHEREIPPGSVMYLFSDGVYELTYPDGRMWELDKFMQTLRATDAPGVCALDEIKKAAETVQGHSEFDDDYSMVRFTFA